MNANEHLDFYNPDLIYYANSRHYIQQLEAMLRQQQAEIERLIMLCDCMTTESNRKGNEIEELKAKLNKYHLKEDLDRNLNLIYGKEFIK